MVREDHFKSAHALARMEYGVHVRRQTINNWGSSTVAAWSHAIWVDESRFQLYPVDGRMRVRQLPGACPGD